MSKAIIYYADIVNKLVVKDVPIIHPLNDKRLFNLKDKYFYAQKFLEDSLFQEFSPLIEDGKNLFTFNYENKIFALYIEHTDSGGRNGKEKPDLNESVKKVEIPFNVSNFSKAIKEYGSVIVADIYFFLKTDDYQTFEVDYDNYVYLFVNPKEIYTSKCARDLYLTGKANPSSRWVSLEEILISLNNNEIIENKNKNVWYVPKTKLRWFFENIFLSEFNNALKEANKFVSEIDISNTLVNDKKSNNQNLKENQLAKDIRKSIFRNNLIRVHHSCQIEGCKITYTPCLIASHIWSVDEINKTPNLTTEDKIRYASDASNGFLLCRNHDFLFDKHLITFDNKGHLKVQENLKAMLSQFDINEFETYISLDEKQLFYLEKHNISFKEKKQFLH